MWLATSPASRQQQNCAWCSKGKGKGKFHPRTGHEGPEGGLALLFLQPRR